MFYLIVVAVVFVAIVATAVIIEKVRIKTLLAKAERGDAQAQLAVYRWYVLSKPDYAIQFLKKSAENGYSEAQVALGKKLMTGDGIEKNSNKAIGWFMKAAEQKSASAYYELAIYYELGDGIEKDTNQALTYIQLAAEQGHAEALYKLGLCYLRGDGVVANSSKAIELCEKAVAKGSKNARLIAGNHGAYGKAIKECCIELAKAGYEEATFCYYKESSSCGEHIRIEIKERKTKDSEDIISIESGNSYKYISETNSTYRCFRNAKNVTNTHMIYLEKAQIIICSRVPYWKDIPMNLKICAAVLLTYNITIDYPEWVREYPDARKYVNTAFL